MSDRLTKEERSVLEAEKAVLEAVRMCAPCLEDDRIPSPRMVGTAIALRGADRALRESRRMWIEVGVVCVMDNYGNSVECHGPGMHHSDKLRARVLALLNAGERALAEKESGK